VRVSGTAEEDSEQNQNVLSVYWLSKEFISNISGTAEGVKLKISGHVEGGC
jgi:hypothetical protein